MIDTQLKKYALALPGQVCRRGGKELLSFIERLAGTAKLKTETEEAQTALDDLREDSLSVEMQVSGSVQKRKELQAQVKVVRDRPNSTGPVRTRWFHILKYFCWGGARRKAPVVVPSYLFLDQI